MRTVLSIVVLALTGAGHTAGIDLGRGEVALTVPAGYDPAIPAPLVMLVHGYTGSGAGQNSYLKLGDLADQYGFFFIAPDGTKEASGDKNSFWNASKACCDFQNSNVDDSGYLSGLIDEVEKRYTIDPDRIFLMGHSNGGFMVHRMAYDHPDTIAAIVSLNGAAPLELDRPRPARPVSVLHIHGTVDKLNAYTGGEIYGNAYPGAPESVRKWAEYGFGATQSTTLPDRIDLDTGLDGDETVVTQYADGRVELWTIEEGGHIPAFPEGFNKRVIDWMYAHPKQ